MLSCIKIGLYLIKKCQFLTGFFIRHIFVKKIQKIPGI